MPLSKEEEKKFQEIKHYIRKEDTKISDENKRFGAKLNDESFKEIDIDDYFKNDYTIGKKIADEVARVGGSWAFVISFVIVLTVWMGVNVSTFFGIHFDPYPFILLNLALSCVSALQAPIIMMSQNRQAEQDAIARDNDFKTNKKASAEIELVHSKLDHQDRKMNAIIKLIELNLHIK